MQVLIIMRLRSFFQIVNGLKIFAGFIEEYLNFGKIILITAKVYMCIVIMETKEEHSEKCSHLSWNFYLLCRISAFSKIFAIYYTEQYISHHNFLEIVVI